MLFTYHAKPLLDFVDKHGNAGNPEHVLLRANLQSALDCNAVSVTLTSDEHSLIAYMEYGQRATTLTLKEALNDNTKT